MWTENVISTYTVTIDVPMLVSAHPCQNWVEIFLKCQIKQNDVAKLVSDKSSVF